MAEMISILALAVMFGFTMKFADLFNEHSLRLFKGDGLLFGILWGLFGALLVMADPAIANVILAMMVAYIIRLRLDYLNHAFAAALIVLTFLVTGAQLNSVLFFTFLAVFIIFGSIRDYVGDVRQKRDWLYELDEPAWYYYIPPFIWSAATGTWIIFWVLAVYRTCYNIAKYGLYRAGTYTKF